MKNDRGKLGISVFIPAENTQAGMIFRLVWLGVALGLGLLFFGCRREVPRPPATLPPPITPVVSSSAGGWIKKIDGLNVLFVAGTPEEMARQEGEFLSHEIQSGVAPQYAEYIAAIKRARQPLASGRKAAQVLEEMYQGLPAEDMKLLQAMAQGAGVPWETLRAAWMFPDIYFYLLAETKGEPAASLPYAVHHSSAFAVWDETADNRRMLIGLTALAPAPETWKQAPTAVWHQPTVGWGYLTLATAGIGAPVFIGMNERGLTALLLFPPLKNPALGRRPALSMTQQIISRAENADQALQLIREAEVNIGMKFLLVDAQPPRALLVEKTIAKTSAMRFSLSPVMVAEEFETPGLTENNLFRRPAERPSLNAKRRRLNILLSRDAGFPDLERVRAILSDRWNPHTGHKQLLGEIIAHPLTAQTIILDPLKGEFYPLLGSGLPPCGYWPGFSLATLFKSGPDRQGAGTADREATSESPECRSLRHYWLAERFFVSANDLSSAQKEVEAALKAYEDPLYYQTLALLKLKAKSFAQAEAAWKRSLYFPLSDYHRGLAHLFLGRTYDLMAQRDPARREYLYVTRLPDLEPELAAAAQQGLSQPYSLKDLEILNIDWSNPDAL